jgi:hypothetical protein
LLAAGCGGNNRDDAPSVVGKLVDDAVNTLSEVGFPVSILRSPSTQKPR